MNIDDLLDDIKNESYNIEKRTLSLDRNEHNIRVILELTPAQVQEILCLLKKRYPHMEIELEKSNGDRSVYINRELVFSNRYIDAIKSLGETRQCSKNILDSARAMLQHHHGDKYEDLYFIDSVTNEVLSRTDYRVKEQEVLPTKAMITMAKSSPHIICIHNHPTGTLPSYEDIHTCFLVGYKYGLIACHGGDIFQYRTLDNINKPMYETELKIYYKKERMLADDYLAGRINEYDLINGHNSNFIKLSANLLDAGVIIKEVLWNGKPQQHNYEG